MPDANVDSAGRLHQSRAAGTSPSMKEAMHALEAREAGFKALPADISEMRALQLHPRLAGLCAGKVARLEAAPDDPADGPQAAEIIRSMIDRITLTPAEDGLAAELHGDIAMILTLCEEAGSNKKLSGTAIPGSQLSVAAGADLDPRPLVRRTSRKRQRGWSRPRFCPPVGQPEPIPGFTRHGDDAGRTHALRRHPASGLPAGWPQLAARPANWRGTSSVP